MLEKVNSNLQNTAKGIGQLAKGQTPFLGAPHNLITKGNTYDELKSALNGQSIINSCCEFVKDYYEYDMNAKTEIVTDSIIHEYSHFYNNNIRTNILLNKLETLQINILSNWQLNKLENDEYIPVDDLDILNIKQKIKFDDDFINQFSFNLITKDNFLIYLDIEDDKINFKIRENYEYFIEDDVLRIVTMIDHNKFIVEKETLFLYERYLIFKNQKGEWVESLEFSKQKETTLNKFFYEVKSGINLVNKSALELSLMHSELYTAFQKELKISPTNLTVDKRLAPNGKFNFYQNAIIEIQRPEGLVEGAVENQEISYNQMQIRANDFQVANDIISNQLDNVLIANQKDLGLDPTATAVNANLSEFAKKINLIKNKLALEINNLLFNLFEIENYIFTIEEFKVDTKDLNNQLDSQEIEKGLDTRLNILRKRNTEWTDDQLMTNYLTIELKLGNPLNAVEEEEARKLGLLKSFQSEGLDLSQEDIDGVDEIEEEQEEVEE